MKEVLRRLKNGIVDEGCYTSKDFKSFARIFKNRFGKEIIKVGGVNHEQHTGHYYLSGFFDVNSQTYYYSLDDVRYPSYPNHKNTILIRTATDHKDYHGGSNHYVELGENMLVGNLPRN